MTRPFMALLFVCVPLLSLRAADQDEPSVQGKTLSEWVKLLKDPSALERRKAALALRTLGAKAAPAAPGLVALLKDTDAIAKNAAEITLLAIGADAVPALADAMKDKSKGLRTPALMLLNRMPDKAKAAIPTLVALLDDMENSSFSYAGSILVRLGPDGVAALHKAAKDPSATVRQTALNALLSAPNTGELVETVAEAIKDEKPTVRTTAVRLAGRLGTQGVPTLVAALKDKDDGVRYAAVTQINTMGRQAKDAAPALRPLLKDRASHVRGLAVTALGNLGSDAKEAVEDLVALLDERDNTLRQQVINSLVRIGTESLPALQKAMKKADEATRQIIVANLGPLGKEGLPLVLAGLKDEAAAVRAASAEALGGGQLPREELKPLTDALKDPEAIVRSAAAGALTRLGEPENALPGLLEGLEDEEQTIRDSTTKAIASAGPRILKPLYKMLESQEEKERRRAALALSNLANPSRVVPLPIPPMVSPRLRRNI